MNRAGAGFYGMMAVATFFGLGLNFVHMDPISRKDKARTHHYLPESGWVSLPLRDEESVDAALSLFRGADDRAVAQHGLPANLQDPATD